MRDNLFFITGIGTGVGKTIVSAIVTEALNADYWKPVQAGDEETDSDWVRKNLSNPISTVHKEEYLFKLPASPHLSAAREKKVVEIKYIVNRIPTNDRKLIIEGPGGILVPLNDTEFVIDLIKSIQCKVILVSRNYLGSINHSLLTAAICKQQNIPVAGWIFNDLYMDYEQQIIDWSGYPRIASIPFSDKPDKEFVREQALRIKENLAKL